MRKIVERTGRTMGHARLVRLGGFPAWLVWSLAIILVVLSGAAYRVLAARLKVIVDTPIELPVPLSYVPTVIGNWSGKDVPIPENIKQAAGNDDFINRLYVNQSGNRWVNVYVAYTARPRTMVGHRPEVCYVGGGWVHDSTEPSEVIYDSGKSIPCSIHRFHWPSSEYQEQVVLSFYVVNGQISSDESVFSGVGWRTPNIKGDPARYVVRVQISSSLEGSTITAAQDMTDLLLSFLPDEQGRVKARAYIAPRVVPSDNLRPHRQ
jgi:hypothetical protein